MPPPTTYGIRDITFALFVIFVQGQFNAVKTSVCFGVHTVFQFNTCDGKFTHLKIKKIKDKEESVSPTPTTLTTPTNHHLHHRPCPATI